MGKHIRFVIIIIWMGLFFIFNKLGFFTGDTNNLSEFIEGFEEFKLPLFVIMSTLRIITFIPSTVFMILGGIMFDPFVALLLSLLSIVLSESIIYLVSKSLFGSRLEMYLSRKYPKIYDLVQENNSEILLIGVLCPFTPTDAICSLSSSSGLQYFKFIAIVAAANIPMVALYSFLGGSLLESTLSTAILAIIIVFITLFSLRLWKHTQYKHKIMKQ